MQTFRYKVQLKHRIFYFCSHKYLYQRFLEVLKVLPEYISIVLTGTRTFLTAKGTLCALVLFELEGKPFQGTKHFTAGVVLPQGLYLFKEYYFFLSPLVTSPASNSSHFLTGIFCNWWFFRLHVIKLTGASYFWTGLHSSEPIRKKRVWKLFPLYIRLLGVGIIQALYNHFGHKYRKNATIFFDLCPLRSCLRPPFR